MGVITTGQTFSSGDQVTASKLNDIANQATFTSASDTTDNSTLTLASSNKLKVKDSWYHLDTVGYGLSYNCKNSERCSYYEQNN